MQNMKVDPFLVFHHPTRKVQRSTLFSAFYDSTLKMFQEPFHIHIKSIAYYKSPINTYYVVSTVFNAISEKKRYLWILIQRIKITTYLDLLFPITLECNVAI